MSHVVLTIPDAIWVIMVIGGIAFSLAMLKTYHSRYPLVASIKDNEVRDLGEKMIRDFIRAERIRLSSHCTSLGIGVIATLIDIPAVTRGTIVVVGLIIINSCSVANTVNAYFSWKLRSKLVSESTLVKKEGGTT